LAKPGGILEGGGENGTGKSGEEDCAS